MRAAWLRRRSTLAFLGTSLVLVAIKLLFDLYSGDYPVRGQAEAFTWPLVGAILRSGWAACLRSDRCNGPTPSPSRRASGGACSSPR